MKIRLKVKNISEAVAKQGKWSSKQKSAMMAESKDPELTSSRKSTKITTICRTAINEKDQNRPEKIFNN